MRVSKLGQKTEQAISRSCSQGIPDAIAAPIRLPALVPTITPSVLVALRAQTPAVPVAIMVARDPRGDCLAWVCGLLGLRVVRGDSEHGGWEALTVLAQEVERGVCALITADGGGPAREAKVGAVALASATGMPLVALGADCRPAIFERHKWDAARTPLPFGRVAIAVGKSHTLQLFREADEVEAARLWLQSALGSVSDTCRQALAPQPERLKRDSC